jgi:hypothetical protein
MLPPGEKDLSKAGEINMKYVVQGSGSSALLKRADGGTLYCIPNVNYVDFAAYFPYLSDNAANRDPADFNKLRIDFTDQDDAGKMVACDFAVSIRGYVYPNTQQVELRFYRLFGKIRLKIAKGDGGLDPEDMKVRLTGMPATATLDLDRLYKDRSLSAQINSAGTVVPYSHLNADGDTLIVELIVPPHEGSDYPERAVHLEDTKGKKKIWCFPVDFDCVGGRCRTIDMTTIRDTTAPDGMTNCYMVKPGESVTFPVLRAYKYNELNGVFTNNLHVDPDSEYTGGFGAKVLWDDNSVIDGDPVVTGTGGHDTEVTVQTTFRSGNAVVKIYKSDDDTETPVWSYHIWVTDYAPNPFPENYNPDLTGETYKGDNSVWMTRQLGMADDDPPGVGLYYQYARKDPLRADANGRMDIVGETGDATFIETIQYPNLYTSSQHLTYTWASANKSISDPCPHGWKVGSDTDLIGWWNGSEFELMCGVKRKHYDQFFFYDKSTVRRPVRDGELYQDFNLLIHLSGQSFSWYGGKKNGYFSPLRGGNEGSAAHVVCMSDQFMNNN